MKSRIAALFCALSISLPLAATARPADETLLAAREAARVGDKAKLERFAAELQTHELAAYAEYWWLQASLSGIDAAAVNSFLARNEGAYLAERLRGEWLKQLGKKQSWEDFDAQYPLLVQPDQELACYALQSRLRKGESAALDEAMPLWMTLPDPPESCQPLLNALVADKRIDADLVWARIRRQFEANRTAGGRYSMNYLPASQTPEAKTAKAVADAPLPWLAKSASALPSGRMQRELMALAVGRIARNDPRIAAEQLARIEPRLQAGEKSWAWGQIAWQGALRHFDEALAWYRKAGEAPLGDEAIQWKVRAALRAEDWKTVRAAIEAMPPALAEQPAWIYWLGRAAHAGGKAEEAGALFARIAGQPNFYGNLADEELGRAIVVPPRAAPATRAELDQAKANASLQRSLALFALGLRPEATREWNWGLRGLNDRQLLAAAEIARRAEVYDRAISSADRTRGEHDYTLRYLAPFAEQVRPAAEKQSLDDAWVYGLMRQESRFVTNARSSAGASGLMQLMPATAKWVARKIGLKDYHHGQVNDTETNLLLGTSYMRMVLESLDNHPVLASVAYNAGPGRARRWRAERPLEGAIYAETIPFNETRDYVKKVMSNAMYYALLFNERAQPIKERLGVVAPRTGNEPKAEELP